jgi:hypothetical protein
MKTKLFLMLPLICFATVNAQEAKLPYYEIPESTVPYSQGSVAARMVDGLGFRYYWASEGLRPEDLSFKASESGRTSAQTIDHIYGLSNFILGAINATVDEDIKEGSKMSFSEKRAQTLKNFKLASDILRSTEDLSVFDNERFKFWNIINGPIADAIWHCGQVVMLRRASGNPFNSKVSVFAGKLRQ